MSAVAHCACGMQMMRNTTDIKSVGLLHNESSYVNTFKEEKGDQCFSL